MWENAFVGVRLTNAQKQKLWPSTIDIYVVRSVIPIPSLIYESLLFDRMEKCYLA